MKLQTENVHTVMTDSRLEESKEGKLDSDVGVGLSHLSHI